MSLLSSFISNQVIKALEAQFVAHEGDLQQAFIQEVCLFVGEVSNWVDGKINQVPVAKVEEK